MCWIADSSELHNVMWGFLKVSEIEGIVQVWTDIEHASEEGWYAQITGMTRNGTHVYQLIYMYLYMNKEGLQDK